MLPWISTHNPQVSILRHACTGSLQQSNRISISFQFFLPSSRTLKLPSPEICTYAFKHMYVSIYVCILPAGPLPYPASYSALMQCPPPRSLQHHQPNSTSPILIHLPINRNPSIDMLRPPIKQIIMQQPISPTKLLILNKQIVIKEGQCVEDVEF